MKIRPVPSRAPQNNTRSLKRLLAVGLTVAVLSIQAQQRHAQIYRAVPGVRIRAMAASAARDIAASIQLTSGMYVIGKFVRSFAPPAALVGYVRCTLDGTMLYVASGSTDGNTRRGAIQISDNAGKLLYRSPELLLDEGRPLGKSIRVSIAPEAMVYGNGDSALAKILSVRGETPLNVTAGLTSREPTEANRNAAVEYWATAIKGTEDDIEKM